MAWWTPPPSLSALHAWDAFDASSTQMLDQISSNHITFGAAGQFLDDPYYKAVWGVDELSSAVWPLAADIPLTGDMTHTLLFHANSSVAFAATAGSSKTLLYLNGLARSTVGTSAITYFNGGAMNPSDWEFFAYTRTAAGVSKFYVNGVEKYTTTGTTYVPTVIGAVGDGLVASRRLKTGDAVAGMAFYTGTASLEEVRALEREARRLLRAPSPPTLILDLGYGLNFGDMSVQELLGVMAKKDDSQNRRVSGIITEAGVPVRRMVRLHETRSGLLKAQMFSAADGSYEFDQLPADMEYFVISFDHTGAANMVGKDRVKP